MKYAGPLSVIAAAVFTAACGPTDDGISAKVKTNLTADETVKTAPIDVGVQKKVVTLSGTVDTAAVKDRAVSVARQTAGVSDVVDKIALKAETPSPESAPGPAFGREMMQKGMKMDGKNKEK